ncbi:MAG: PAS domain-containing protein [Candidatus Omnitrophica bacterium]|nr:PAS domain-containing protein [Candidatus Omnitrophota bacterium]
MNQLAVFVTTALASVMVGFLLYRLANVRGHVDAAKEAPEEDKQWAKAIRSQLDSLTAPARDRERVEQELSQFFDAEIEKAKNEAKEEVARKYDEIVEEKKRSLKQAMEKVRTADEQVKLVNQKYKKVELEKEQTESVVRSIAEGLVVVDNEGKVLMMNPAAEKILGGGKEGRIGKNISSDLDETQLVSFMRPGAESEEHEIELASTQDETKKVIRASTAVIENESGKTVGMVSVLTDVTKQRELEQLKKDFVNNVSHELRTPLVTLQKALALVQDESTGGNLSETQKKFLAIALRNQENLSRLIDDLLDIAKLESGRMRLDMKPVHVDVVIESTCQNLEPWAGSKNIKIERKFDKHLPEMPMDAKRIGQVLTNLIGNSIKFTPQGGKITVEAQGLLGLVEVSVRDTGVGIPKEELGRIFDKFYQVRSRAHSDVAGTGLGLSIAKEIVELHGGKIWVESEPGKGTEFTFTISPKS